MEFALKSIKHMASMSQETNCFSATLYIDGKAFCIVKNPGYGGRDDYEPLPKGPSFKEVCTRIDEINRTLAQEKITTKLISNGEPIILNNSLELVVGKILERSLDLKWIKSQMKRNVMAVSAQNKILAYSIKPALLKEDMKTTIEKRDSVTILNGKTDDEVYDLMKAK